MLRRFVNAAVLLFALALPGSAAARVYYVAPHGSDRSAGTSPSRAWRTVTRVDKAHLRAGDEVLFQGGASFSDNTLMPGWGLNGSGRPGRPIVFGSYGGGQARIDQGIWFRHGHDLVFQDLRIGPAQGLNATGSRITVQRCTMRNFLHGVIIPLQPHGSYWTITGNVIDRTGDSGMKVEGDHYLIAGNRITSTSLDRSLGYGLHGIYLKASDSTVTGNFISGYRDNGVSVRYRGSLVTRNFISGGQFGIAYFQGDRATGHSTWSGNVITHTAIAAIYVSPYGDGGRTHEHITIAGNRLSRPSGARAARGRSSWQAISLSRDSAGYTVRGNQITR